MYQGVAHSHEYVNYTQIAGKTIDFEFTQSEADRNDAGDGYYLDGCGYPMDKDVVFTRHLMPHYANLAETGQLIRLSICPLTARLIHAAMEAMRGLPPVLVPLPPNMMIDPFTGITCQRTDLSKLWEFDPEMLSPSHKEQYYERECIKALSKQYEPQEPMRLGTRVGDQTEQERTFMQNISDCVSMCATIDPDERDTRDDIIHKEPVNVVIGNMTEKHVGKPVTVGAVHDWLGSDISTETDAEEEGGFRHLPQDLYENVDIPDWPKVATGCCCSFGSPYCERCGPSHVQDAMKQVSANEVTSFQYRQFSAFVNQAVDRENLALRGQDPGGWDGVPLKIRQAFTAAYANCANIEGDYITEVACIDTEGHSYQSYLRCMPEPLKDVLATLDYREYPTEVHGQLRLSGRRAVEQASDRCKASIARVRSYVFPVWLNDAIIGTAVRLGDCVYTHNVVTGPGVRIDTCGGLEDQVDMTPFSPIAVHRMQGLPIAVGLPSYRPPVSGEQVVIMVSFDLCIVPVGPYTVRVETRTNGNYTCIEDAFLSPVAMCTPAVALSDGKLVGLNFSNPYQTDGSLLLSFDV